MTADEGDEDEDGYGPVRMSPHQFRDGVEEGVYGPDDGSYYYVVVEAGAEREVPFDHPRSIPPEAVAVIYYSK